MEKLPSYRKMLEFMPKFGVPLTYYSSPKNPNLEYLELSIKAIYGLILFRLSPSIYYGDSFCITYTSPFHDPTDLSYFVYRMVTIGGKTLVILPADPTINRSIKIFYDFKSIINHHIRHYGVIRIKSITEV